jgi:hypothetical protein
MISKELKENEHQEMENGTKFYIKLTHNKVKCIIAAGVINKQAQIILHHGFQLDAAINSNIHCKQEDHGEKDLMRTNEIEYFLKHLFPTRAIDDFVTGTFLISAGLGLFYL